MSQAAQVLASVHMKLTPEERATLNSLVLVLDEFRKIEPGMPIQQAVTLLTIALNPGTTVSEIAKIAGNTLSSTSRHVEAFGPWREAKKVGKEMVVDDYNDVDRRAKVIHLTAKGVRVLKSLMHYLNRR